MEKIEISIWLNSYKIDNMPKIWRQRENYTVISPTTIIICLKQRKISVKPTLGRRHFCAFYVKILIFLYIA